ncbi:MAG: PAS domain S-box protein [Chthoniobacteraceae bacterium]
MLLDPILHEVAPLQLFLVGVVVSAWLGGFWPGMVSTFLGFLLSWWFFIPPIGFYLPDQQNFTRMMIFLVDCLAISAIGESMQRTLTRERGHRQALYKLAAIVESSEDAIISKNLDGTITSWNQAAERIFGYPMGEAIGQHISLLIPTERLPEETEIIRRVQKGLSINHFETVRRRKDGTLIDVSLTISPVKDFERQDHRRFQDRPRRHREEKERSRAPGAGKPVATDHRSRAGLPGTTGSQPSLQVRQPPLRLQLWAATPRNHRPAHRRNHR